MKTVVKNRINEETIIYRSSMIKYFASSILAIVFGNIGQIVGNIIIGNTVGESKLAVMSLVLPIYYVFATIGNLTGIGGSALCAKLVGSDRIADCKRAYTVTYIITLASSIFFSVLFLLFMPEVVYALGTSKELYRDVMDYAVVMTIGGVFTACVYLSFNFLRLDGKSLSTTLTFVIMGVLNIVFNFVLTATIKMGVMGISVATSIGAAAASLFGPVIIAKNSESLGFVKVSFNEIKRYSLSILKIGSPGATENISILLKNYLLNRIIVGIVGSMALSSLSVLNSINSFATAIVVGCAGTLVPFIGVFSAEKDILSIKRTVKTSCKACLFVLLVFVCIVFIFAPYVSKLFGVQSADGLAMTAKAIRYFCISLILSVFTTLLIYLHLANGHTAISNILTVLKNFAFLVLSALILLKTVGSDGLGISFIACEVLTLAAAAVIHFVAVRKDKNLSYLLLLPTDVEKNGKSVAICVMDNEEEMSGAIDEITDFCMENELDKKQKMLITLSIDEMLHAIAEHSTKDSKIHLISARILLHNGVTVMRIRYNGKKFNPIEYYESRKKDANDLDAMLELEDSIGIKMIVDACDVVDYRTTFGLNNLTMLL